MSSDARELIQRNIAAHGFHIYVVSGGPSPTFAYTIGLSSMLGFEVVIGGVSAIPARYYGPTIDHVARLEHGQTRPFGSTVILPAAVNPIPDWEMVEMDESWANLLLLGANEHYQTIVQGVQVRPAEKRLWTIDTPRMEHPWVSGDAWNYLNFDWEYDFPRSSKAVTNLPALKGEPITEAGRWEVDYWELFAGNGPEVPKTEIRKVPIWTLLANDPSLSAVTVIEIGKSLWRKNGESWKDWIPNRAQ